MLAFLKWYSLGHKIHLSWNCE